MTLIVRVYWALVVVMRVRSWGVLPQLLADDHTHGGGS